MIPQFDPVVRKGQNLTVLSQGSEKYFTCRFAEGMPASSQSVIDFGAISGSGSTSKALQSTLQLDWGYLLQVRVLALDPKVELQLWELAGNARWWTKNWQARVSRMTRATDPSLVTTEFFIYGFDRDAYFVVNNLSPASVARSRFLFFGYKYLLDPLDAKPAVSTWIPAEAAMG